MYMYIDTYTHVHLQCKSSHNSMVTCFQVKLIQEIRSQSVVVDKIICIFSLCQSWMMTHCNTLEFQQCPALSWTWSNQFEANSIFNATSSTLNPLGVLLCWLQDPFHMARISFITAIDYNFKSWLVYTRWPPKKRNSRYSPSFRTLLWSTVIFFHLAG